MSKCWTESGGITFRNYGIDGDTDVKYTMQESERIVRKITNILNGQAINAWRRKNLQINDVKLDEDRRKKVKEYVGNFLRDVAGFYATIEKWKSWPEIISIQRADQPYI